MSPLPCMPCVLDCSVLIIGARVSVQYWAVKYPAASPGFGTRGDEMREATPKRRAGRLASSGPILEAATTLFLRRGYLGTSMDEIAALASVSKQTLYTHFADKER